MTRTRADRDGPFGAWLDSLQPAVIKNDARLAAAIGVPQSTVLAWRRGAVPSSANLLKLAELTGTSMDTITKIATSKEK